MLNFNGNIAAWIYQLDENNTDLHHQYVTIIPSDDVQSISESFVTVENIKTLRVAFTVDGANINPLFYVDDISVK